MTIGRLEVLVEKGRVKGLERLRWKGVLKERDLGANEEDLTVVVAAAVEMNLEMDKEVVIDTVVSEEGEWSVCVWGFGRREQ